MRLVGITLVSLGIWLLILSGLVLIMGRMFGLVLFIALVPVPMIASGVAIVRRAEDAAVERAREAAGDGSGPLSDPAPLSTDNSLIPLARIHGFDLNRLNWGGWLLLLGTIGFVMAEAAVVVWVVGEAGWQDGRPPRLLGLPMVLLTIAFFVGVKWLLGTFGVSIYRNQGAAMHSESARYVEDE